MAFMLLVQMVPGLSLAPIMLTGHDQSFSGLKKGALCSAFQGLLEHLFSEMPCLQEDQRDQVFTADLAQ